MSIGRFVFDHCPAALAINIYMNGIFDVAKDDI
jgi:hypothetical protein